MDFYKRSETKRSETKRSETKRNQAKPSETKRNQAKPTEAIKGVMALHKTIATCSPLLGSSPVS